MEYGEILKAKEIFENLSNNEKINYWNDFCDSNYYYSDKIYCLNGCELEALFNSIEDFAKSVSDSNHFNYNDDYFKIGDVYGDILTGDWFEDLADPDDYFYEWLQEEYTEEFTEEEEAEEE